MSDTPTQKQLAVWHPGEKALQAQVGMAERMQYVGQRAIRGYLPDQHRDFLDELPFIVAGSVGRSGDAWATLLVGEPGFISTPTSRAVEIHARLDPIDPASEGMREGDAIGLLGIELHTRRRNRVNGILRAAPGGAIRLEVDQSFGNCPQYIQLRDYYFARDPDEPFAGDAHESSEIDQAARDIIAAADTFFVASYADREDRRQVDVSHRGGRAGFVRVAPDGLLTIPDFSGNFFFATLGNILLNGKAGLAFVDFQTGDLLQLTGDAAIVLDSPEIEAFQGAERLWNFRARRVVRRSGALALRWMFRENGWAPQSLQTGEWSK